MKVLFDTSVLIAAMLPDHTSHDTAAAWLSRAKQGVLLSFVSGHSLAEIYAVLTRLPRTPRIHPSEAQQLIRENVLTHATVVTLSGENYLAIIDGLVQYNLTGGITYDAIIAKAAELSAVDYLLTLNIAHFERVWPTNTHRITSPAALIWPHP